MREETIVYYIGVDLGGTNVAAGIVDEKGKLLGKASVPCPRGAEDIADAMGQSVNLAAEQAGVEVSRCELAGVASPGKVDPESGTVSHAYNLGMEQVTPLAEMVSQRLGLPVLLENDANAAALGEFIAGAGVGYNSLVAVTLGTGVGAGAVLNGKLYTGFNYAAMEAGHMVIRRGGRACSCGRKGCWEAYASATGLIRSTREAMETDPGSILWNLADSLDKVNGKTPFDGAAAGDKTAQGVIDEYIEDLACGIANLIDILQPEILCIGGGICGQGENLLRPLRAALDREEFTKDSAKRTQLCVAQLGNDAGIIGGALVSRYR